VKARIQESGFRNQDSGVRIQWQESSVVSCPLSVALFQWSVVRCEKQQSVAAEN